MLTPQEDGHSFASYTVDSTYALFRLFLIRSCCSKDFVMYAGGSVWALDWCPAVHRISESHAKSEVKEIPVKSILYFIDVQWLLVN